MDEQPTKRGGGTVAAILVVVVLLLPVLYVLSVGPAAWLLQVDRIDKSWIPVVLAFYRPVAWIEKNVPCTREPLAGYRYWWLTKKKL